MAARRVVTVELVAKTTGLMAGFATTAAAVKGLGKEFETLSVKHTQSFNKLTTAGLGMGIALVGSFGLAERAAMAFDKRMSAVGAVMDKTGLSTKQISGQMTQLRTSAIQAGRDSAYTATQAASAEEELAKAGISTADILGGALKGALALAAAGDINLADAAKIAAQALTEFQLKGKDVGHIADVLTAGANASVTSVGELGQSLDQVGSVAHQAGFGLEETVGVLAAFSQAGLSGAEGGTAFKTMLLKLENPTNTAKTLMDRLGLSVYDAKGNFVSAATLAGNLQKSLGGLTNEQRNAALGTIFGTRAVRGAIDMYNLGTAGVNEWTAKVSQSGIAEQTAAEKLNNLSGDVKKLEGSLQALAITSTGGVNSGLRFLTQGAEGLVNAFSDLPTGVQSTVTVIGMLGGASLLAAGGLGKAYGAVKGLQASLEKMGPLGTKMSGLVGTVGKFSGVATIAAAAGFGLYSVFHALSDSAKPVTMNIDDLTTSLARFALTGAADGELAKKFGKDLAGITDQARQLDAAMARLAVVKTWPNSPSGGRGGGPDQKTVQESIAQRNINNLSQPFKEIDTGLTDLVTNGQISAATTDFSTLALRLERAGWDMTRINALFPQYTKAAGDAALQTYGLSQGFASSKEAAISLTMTLGDQVKMYGSLLAAEKALTGANTAFLHSEDSLYASYDAATAAIKANGKTLDVHTAKGRANQETLLAIAEAAKQAAQDTLTKTGSDAAANKVLQQAHDILVKDAIAMGLSKKAADAYAKSILEIPAGAKTYVELSGITRAISQVGQLRQEIDRLHGKVVNVTITHGNVFTGGSQASVNRWGGLYQHAAVGVLRDAQVYSPVSRGARYAFAEPQTGGEAFVPKHGDYGRSMSILGRAAGWYGASVVPGGGGGAISVNVHFTAAPGQARAMLESLRWAINLEGGDPVRSLTPR